MSSSSSSWANSARSHGGSPQAWIPPDRRGVGSGFLHRLRAARGSTACGKNDNLFRGNSKKSERVLDVLQTLRVRNNADVYRDDATTTTAETRSLASTATSSFPSIVSPSLHSIRTPLSHASSMEFQFNHGVPLRRQEHEFPSLSTTAFSIGVNGTRFPSTLVGAPRPIVQHKIPPLFDAISSGAPYHVVSQLLKEDSMSPWHQNNAGMTALHCAIERYDTGVDVLMLLLSAYPGAAGIRCCRGFNCVDLLGKRFLEPDDFRSGATKDKAASLRQCLEVSAGINFEIQQRQSHAQYSLQEDGNLRDFWEMIAAFIRAAASYRDSARMIETSPSYYLVHNCVEIDCHPLLLRFALALHPDETQMTMDNQGRLPLHVAAKKSARATREVLRAYPRAASVRDGCGRLPLHYAIQHGQVWTDAIQDLTEAAAMSYTAKDPIHCLPPSLAASCTRSPDLTTIFCLLLANPSDIINSTLQLGG